MHLSDSLPQPQHADSPLPAGAAWSPTEAELPPQYTAPQHFFRQQTQPMPAVDPLYWSFMLGGLVTTPVLLSYADLLDSAAEEQACVLACIGSPAGGPLTGSARWAGVPLRHLLAEAGISSAARHVHLHAADGYATSVPLEWAQDALLAWRMNDAPVPLEHGGPVRLLVPGLYGYKMPKWIQRVVLAPEPLAGPWEQRGWSPLGIVQTTAAIVTPVHLEPVRGPVRFTGIAYAGRRTVTAVALSIEDGPWMPADLVPGPPGAWVRWHALWTPPAPGDYHVSARASDDTGSIQPVSGTPFPDGTAAAHSIVVRVSG